MKIPKIKKIKYDISDIIFILFSVFAFIYSVYLPVNLGIADQGDFERVMNQAGLAFVPEHTFYDYVNPHYVMKITNPLFLKGIVPSTSYIYPIFAAKLICRILFTDCFDTRILAAVMFLIYDVSCLIILKNIKIHSQIIKSIIAVLFVFVFFDGTNLIIFNSLYGQSMMLVSTAMFIAAVGVIINNFDFIKKRYLVFLFISSVFLLGAKLQCFVFLPFVLAIFFYLYRNCEHKKMLAVFMCILVWYTAGHYIIRGGGLNQDTQYNSIFYGILKDSDNPEEDLKNLGIDEDMAADAGKHAYLPQNQYKYPPRTDIMQEKFYSKMSNIKLIKFYFTHPLRLLKGMEITANNAFDNYIDLGTFMKSSGKPPNSNEYRFDLYSFLRNKLPKTLFFIIPVYLVFLSMGIIYYIKTKNKFALLYIFVILMGAMQFPMPYIGNGNADISKQLYLFNISFDFGIFCIAAVGFKKLDLLTNKGDI